MTVHIFDFDYTLVHTAEEQQGKTLYERTYGKKWPYVGWWSYAESLDMEMYIPPLNMATYRYYLKVRNLPDTKVYLVTGRLEKLKPEVDKILDYHGLEFDGVYCSYMRSTLEFKKHRFDRLAINNDAKKIVIYDDRYDHLMEFKAWALDRPYEVSIYDAKNKIWIL